MPHRLVHCVPKKAQNGVLVDGVFAPQSVIDVVFGENASCLSPIAYEIKGLLH